MILAIDPGTHQSALVVYDPKKRDVVLAEIVANERLNDTFLKLGGIDLAVIEMVASYGQPVGAEVFETCVLIGRLMEMLIPIRVERITRQEIKRRLCHKVVGINDAVIRQRLIDLYGGKERAIGKKKTPGPLYGITKDLWAALAVAVAWETRT